MFERRFGDSHYIAAMLGGVVPTMCSVGSQYAVHPESPLPQFGLLIAVAIFAFLGLAVSYGLSPADRRQAFAMGISGPAIIASIVSGAKPPQVAWNFDFAPSAYAQQSGATAENTPPGNPSVLYAGVPSVAKNSRVVVLGYSPASAGQVNSKIDVSGTTGNGKDVAIGSFWGNSAHSNIIIALLTSIRLRSQAGNGAKTKVPIELDTKQIEVTPAVESSFGGDLLWGLGANRNLSVSNFEFKKSDKITIPKNWDQQYIDLVK